MSEGNRGRKSSLFSLGYTNFMKASRCKSFGLNISVCLELSFPPFVERWAEILTAEKINCNVFLNPALKVLYFPQGSCMFLHEHTRAPQDSKQYQWLSGCEAVPLHFKTSLKMEKHGCRLTNLCVNSECPLLWFGAGQKAKAWLKPTMEAQHSLATYYGMHGTWLSQSLQPHPYELHLLDL